MVSRRIINPSSVSMLKDYQCVSEQQGVKLEIITESVLEVKESVFEVKESVFEVKESVQEIKTAVDAPRGSLLLAFNSYLIFDLSFRC